MARRAPRFLFDGGALHAAESEQGKARDRWLAAACEQARDLTRAGLPGYGWRAPPLAPGFPWGGNAEASSDVMHVVRIHRFAFAPRLALAVVGGAYSAGQFCELLHDWMRHARRAPALPFISTFLVTQRLIACSCAFHFLGAANSDPDGDRLRLTLLDMIFQDIAYLLPRLGKSYPNGHLLTDRFAAWFIAAAWPDLSYGRVDMAEAEALWLAELERQTYADGGDFEHALGYHGLATEQAVAYLVLKRNNGSAVAAPLVERIRRMLAFQADLAGPDGCAPAFGDATEDPMLPLDGGTGSTPGALREIFRALFDSSVPPLAPRHPAGERAHWLAGSAALPQAVRARRLAAYPDSGLFAFFDDDETTRCVFRTGPVANTLTMSGHMHSDLMSVYLFCRSVPVLVDAGTCTYRFLEARPGAHDPNWRAYLAGPLAHNGIVLGGEDPLGAVQGDFRSGPAGALVQHSSLSGERLGAVTATFTTPSSYEGAGRGVVHVRGEYFLVYNVLPRAARASDVEFRLQFSPRVELIPAQGRRLLASDGRETDMALVYSDDLALLAPLKGSREPVGGWVSPAYGEIEPATQLVFNPAGTGAASGFVFGFNRDAQPARLVAFDLGRGGLAFEVEGAGFRDCVIVNLGLPETAHEHAGIEFAGRFLWLRVRPSLPPMARALDCRYCRAPGFGIESVFERVRAEVDIGP